MGFFDFLFGRNRDQDHRQQPQQQWGEPQRRQPGRQQGTPLDENARALQRYHYMLQTAPPETIEQAHAEAFAQLTPEQRRMVLQNLSQTLPEHERNAAHAQQEDPRSLARMATRAEMRQPGTLERNFGNMDRGRGGSGIGMGGLMAGSFLSTIAGVVIGSAIANAFFDDSGYSDETGSGDSADAGSEDPGAGDQGFEEYGAEGDPGTDMGSDFGSDFGGDFGGDFGDFGGGDFGGDF